MKKYITIILLAVIGFQSKAQRMATLKKDMYGIASDATEGRFTGSEGYLKAAGYVQKELKAAGITPGWTIGNKKTYLQPVPFIWDDYSASKLVIKGQAYPHSAQNFIVIQRGPAKAGKWVVLSAGDSVRGKPAGVILLPSPGQANDWETTVIRQYRFAYMHYLPDGPVTCTGTPTIIVSPLLAKMLVKGDSIDVKLNYLSQNKTGYNVIGVVPGTNRRLAHRAIVISAHLDHIGRIGNHIYNGANDDASGCVAELGAAKMLAVHPARRAIIFTFFCGEELDLKGSRWFADHPPVPLSHIAMLINLEQLGSKHRSFNGVWALGDTLLKPAFYKAASNFTAQKLRFSPADSVIEVLRNTDTYSLMSKHIPSLLLGSGGFDEHHTPEDKINLIDFEHLQKAALLLYNLIVLTGDQR